MLDDRLPIRRIAFSEVAEIDRETRHRFEHALKIPDAGALDPDRLRPGSSTDHRRKAGRLVLVELLHRVEMEVDVDKAGRRDLPFDREYVRVGADNQSRGNIHDIWIPGLAHPHDLAIQHADVALDDPEERIDEYGVRNDKIERAIRALEPRYLAHSVANRFPAAKDEFVTLGGHIRLDLRDEPGVGKMDAVSRGRPVLAGVVVAIDEDAHDLPSPSSLISQIEPRPRLTAKALDRRPP